MRIFNSKKSNLVLLRYPVRYWQDWLRVNTYRSYETNKIQACFKLSVPLDSAVARFNLVRAALTQELHAVKQFRGGHTLTRSEVSVSKKKVWRQKGTGRARAGSKSSPLWKGGGVFGPHRNQQIKSITINKKAWKAALECIIYNRRWNIMVIQGPWHTEGISHGLSDNFYDGFKQLSLLGLSQKSSVLAIIPNHIASTDTVSNPAYPFNVKIKSFSRLKCIDLLRADFVLLIF